MRDREGSSGLHAARITDRGQPEPGMGNGADDGAQGNAIRSVLERAAQRLTRAGMAHARHEAEWLLGRLVGRPRLELYVEEGTVTAATAKRFFAQIEARVGGVPLQYVLEEAEFHGERFRVVPGVFIPRPETEGVVACALEALRERQRRVGRPLRLLDLGTGSGCIAVTLARRLPACVVVGVELSWDALRVAQDNVRRHGVEAQVQLLQGSWLEAIRGRFDGVVVNPPYVPSAQVDRLPHDVRHEPRVSLDGGTDGMRDLLRVLDEAPRILRPGGIVALECGEEQTERLVSVAQDREWTERVRSLEDLAGRARGVVIRARQAGV